MPIAILDLDFEQLPQEITGLDRYTGALALIRLGGRPVGQALLPVVNGRVGDQSLRDAILYAADSGFWDAWLKQRLGVAQERRATGPIPRATVAVCTRDRPEDMKLALDALMRLAPDGQELLIIDNCPSSDATYRVVQQFPGVRYVREDRPGLDIARNRALREAKHEIIAFTDDDAAPDPFWLRNLLRNFDDPLVLCVNGMTMPIELETDAQIFFQRSGGLGRGFKRAVYDCAVNDPLEAWQSGAGTNMALRRSVVERVGAFDEGLDVGTPVRGGGDTDIFRRILTAGFRIVYDPEAVNWHRHRRDWAGLRRQLYGYESAGFAVWARCLFIEGEMEAAILAWRWIRREVPAIVRQIVRPPSHLPHDLSRARFFGALGGPWSYLYAHWLLRRRKETP